MIDLRYVKKLLEMLDESTVDSLEITSEKGMKIRLAKTPVMRGVSMAAPMAMPAMQAMPAAAPAAPVAQAGGAPAAAAADAAPARQLREIKSPMVGTFYARPEPTANAYVSQGTRVSQGQTVCIIEAMKIMNEIESEFSGTIVEVCVADAQPVEYGQVLFKVDPNG
ncbi:MAG: acetyl-CoA carboxylase biotin carboxyl carrier protein [Gemmatimonadaceae bacterium]|nr:acetyl-CoA carboxylase biotin carboxyl carrier protein [Gemmatimonadaceae bacterium]